MRPDLLPVHRTHLRHLPGSQSLSVPHYPTFLPGLAPTVTPPASFPPPSPAGFAFSLPSLVSQMSVSLGTPTFFEGLFSLGPQRPWWVSPQYAPISAPAKCAQLLVSIKHKRPEDQDVEGFQKVLHFGSVAVGCTAKRQIRLYNPLMVCVLCVWGE